MVRERLYLHRAQARAGRPVVGVDFAKHVRAHGHSGTDGQCARVRATGGHKEYSIGDGRELHGSLLRARPALHRV